jgi:hypothetical protein
MKFRKGFVSNSSSSSFIITGNIETDKMVVSVDISSFGTLIKTKEQLEAYYMSEYDEYHEEDKHIQKLLAVLESGKSIFCGRVDNDMVSVLDYLDGDLDVDVDY